MSVRPSIFYMQKYSKTGGNQCQCSFQWPATSYCHQRSGPSRMAGTDPWNSDTATAVCVGVCVRSRVRAGAGARVCACACVGASVRAFVRACDRACVRDVFAIYDNNI